MFLFVITEFDCIIIQTFFQLSVWEALREDRAELSNNRTLLFLGHVGLKIIEISVIYIVYS